MSTPCEPFDHFRLEVPDLRLFAAVFETACDGVGRIDPAEIAWGGFIPLDELARRLDEWPFAPCCKEFYERFLASRAG